MKACALLCLLFFASPALSGEGDLGLTLNVWTKHVNNSEYFTKGVGNQAYFEKNKTFGFRYGLSDHMNIGYGFGLNSYKKHSHIVALEYTFDVHKYIEVGVMGGVATGYKIRTDSGVIPMGGPFVRGKTQFFGVTVAMYGKNVVIVNVDIPIAHF